MSESSRRVFVSCLVIIVVTCLCLSLVSIGGAIGIFFLRKEPISFDWLTPKNTPQATTTLTNEEIARQMDEIQAQVSRFRGLKTTSEVKRTLLTTDQLRQHVTDDFLKDYSPEEAQNDVISLAAFGLLPPDFDLHNFLSELYSEQIAGFYDHETKEMFVVQDESFQGPERLTYAHEFTHVLQDQNYDIQNGLNYKDEICEIESERCAGVQALLEGDASLTETTWFQTFGTNQDRKEILEKYNDYQSPIYDRAPDFLKEDFIFPYQQGLEFVQFLYDKGGWRAIDEAYRNLPASTEQILHPEKYPNDQPELVTLPDLTGLLGVGWKQIDQGVLGEWYTFLVLAHGNDPRSRLNQNTASTAAEGWGGDAYVVYYNASTNQTLMSLKTRWDTPNDAKEFISAFESYASNRFGKPTARTNGSTSWETEQGYTGLYYQGSETIWLFSPDASTADSILPDIQNP